MLIREYFTAGLATFTVSNDVTGERYTYRVEKREAKAPYPEMYFISYLTGSDNDTDYSCLGVLDPKTLRARLTAKSKLAADSKPFKVLNWALGLVAERKDLPEGYAIRHDSYCSRCRRHLTVPESIDTGLGPDCAEQMGVPYACKKPSRRPKTEPETEASAA